MGYFCANCGRALQDGEICNCKNPAAETPDATVQFESSYTGGITGSAPVTQTKDAKDIFSGYIEFLKEYLRAPIEAVKKLIDGGDVVTASISLGVYFLFLLFFLLAAFKISFFKTLLYAIIITVAILAFSVVGLCLLLKIFKIDVDIKPAFIAVGSNTLFPAACMILAFIFALLSVAEIVGFFLLLAFIAWAVLAFLVPHKLFGLETSGYAIWTDIGLFGIVSGINFYLIYRIVASIMRSFFSFF